MRDLPPIYVLRHGETEWNLADRIQGWHDSRLTETGRKQAQIQGRLLAPVLCNDVHIRVSSSGRALETARLALGRAVEHVTKDDRLREVNVGDWSGRRPTDIAKEHPWVRPGVDRHLWKFEAPGGETLEEMTVRCRAVLSELSQPTILITHGVTSRLLRCLALGLPPAELSTLPGGQGVVHAIMDGKAQILSK